MKENSDIKRALERMAKYNPGYAKYHRYYDADQPLAYATDKFLNAFGELFTAFAYNHCHLVVDALTERLTVTGFAPEQGTTQTIAEKAWQLWLDNRMDLRAGEVHTEAAKAGDAYVIVWPDKLGNPAIYPQDSQNVTVFYDEDTPGLIVLAAKSWTLGNKRRLNLYYTDRIEKYISKSQSMGVQDLSASTDVLMVTQLAATGYEPYRVPGEEWPLAHDYGRVPVFHFGNNAGIGKFGRSEMQNIIPVQDALNKIAADMLVAMEYNAYRQRWATGLEVDLDENTGLPKVPFFSGPGQVWSTESAETRFGEFEAVDTGNYLNAISEHQRYIAVLSSTPLHNIIPMADPPSGEALKTLEAKFVKKCEKRETAFGNVWEDVMQFALLIAGMPGAALSAEWADPSPTSEKERAEIAQLDNSTGLPEEWVWKQRGLTDQEIADLQTARDTRQAAQNAQRLAQVQAQAALVPATLTMGKNGSN